MDSWDPFSRLQVPADGTMPADLNIGDSPGFGFDSGPNLTTLLLKGFVTERYPLNPKPPTQTTNF